jgi:hypothetical protein
MAAPMGQFRLFSTYGAASAALQPVQPVAASPAAFSSIPGTQDRPGAPLFEIQNAHEKNADPVSRFSLDRISTERVRFR